MNILIVEDETALAEAVAHILRKAGHSADRVEMCIRDRSYFLFFS